MFYAKQSTTSHRTFHRYLGTATYDLPEPRAKQTAAFVARGARVVPLEVALGGAPSPRDAAAHAALLADADAV